MPAEDLDEVLVEPEDALFESACAKQLRILQGHLVLELPVTNNVSIRAGTLADLIIADLIARPHLRSNHALSR